MVVELINKKIESVHAFSTISELKNFLKRRKDIIVSLAERQEIDERSQQVIYELDPGSDAKPSQPTPSESKD